MMLFLPKENRGIISLVTVFAVGLFALGTSLTLATGALGELAKNRDTNSGDQSLYSAEANTREGAYQFQNDPTYAGGASLLLNDTTTSSITATSLGWPYAKVKGEAENPLTNRKVSHVITVYPEGLAFDHAVYAQDSLVFKGNLTVASGSVFANTGIDFDGASAEILGNAYSGGEIDEHDEDSVGGETVAAVAYIPAPQIDLEPYRDAAAATTPSSTLFFSSSDAKNYLNGQTRDAVVFVDATTKTTISSSDTNLTGSLVTMGDLDLLGGTYQVWPDYVAIIVEGDLKIAGGTTIYGIVYVKGSTSFGGGNNTITGSLISAGGASVTDLTGNATIYYDPDIATSFQNLEGLNTTSTTTPRILLWEEE